MLRLPAPLLPTRAATVWPLARAPLSPVSRAESRLSCLPAVNSVSKKVVPQPLLQPLERLAARVTLTPAPLAPAPTLTPIAAELLLRWVASVSLPTAALSVMSRAARRLRSWLALTRAPTRLMSPDSARPPLLAIRLTLRPALMLDSTGVLLLVRLSNVLLDDPSVAPKVQPPGAPVVVGSIWPSVCQVW